MQTEVVSAEVWSGHADPMQGPRESTHSELLRELEQFTQDVNALPPFY